MLNSTIWPNSAPLQDIRLRNLSDIEFDLSRSLKVKCDDVIQLVIHGFLLIYTVITCLTLTIYTVALIGTQNVFLLSRVIRRKLRKIASAPNDPKMTWNSKRPKVLYMLNYYPRVPNFTPFCSIKDRFLDN